MGWERDSQRARVYKAENELVWYRTREFDSLEEVERYVNSLTGKAWFKKMYGSRKVKVEPKRNNAKARGGYGTVWLPRWAWTKGIIAHEVAHAVKYTDPWHSPVFCGHFIFLVEKTMGADKAMDLKRAFLRNKVDWVIVR